MWWELRTPTCKAMVHDKSHKFHKLWGFQGWVNRNPGDDACWSYDPHFFENALKPEQCEANWLEGAMGGRWDRPRFTSMESAMGGQAPALLGFDDTIWDYCSQLHPQSGMADNDWNREVARRCVAANQNILRIVFSNPQAVGRRRGWDMCTNFQWVLCAVRGLLPGQGSGNKIHFAKAPRQLDTRDMEDPGRTGGWWLEPHWQHYAVSDVFFAEVCLLSMLCRNSWQLFTVWRGQMFECDFDEAGYAQLTRALSD